jgi:hypothetical protein
MGGKHEDDGGQDGGAVGLDERLRIASRRHLPALLQEGTGRPHRLANGR